jgi:hypothetical protein
MICPPTIPRTGRPAQADSARRITANRLLAGKMLVIFLTDKLISLKIYFINKFPSLLF